MLHEDNAKDNAIGVKRKMVLENTAMDAILAYSWSLRGHTVGGA